MPDFMSDISIDGVLRGRPKDGVCGIYDQTEKQYFPIGMKLPLHGRTFRYSRAGAAITLSCRGVYNSIAQSWKTAQGGSARGYAVNAAEKGDKKIIVTVNDALVDDAPNGGLYKNWFAGGTAIVYNIAGDNGVIASFRISGSEKSYESVGLLGSGYEDIVIYLDDALPWDLTPDASPATSVDLYPSPYIALKGSPGVSTIVHRFVAIPLIAVDSGYFFWGQTLGPCMVTPYVGITSYVDHEVVFHGDGTVKVRSSDTEAQRAGYMLQNPDDSNDDPLLMLQLE